MQFKEVIGQAAVKIQLTEMVQRNRLSHALLFLGKEGSGALPLALAFSQYVVCEKQGPEALEDSCGVCPACLKAASLAHPDIHYSYPFILTKPGEKQISTSFIDRWRDFVKASPYGNLFDWLQMLMAPKQGGKPDGKSAGKLDNKQGNISAEECNDIIRKLNLKTFESRYKVLVMWMPEFLGKEGNKLLKLIEEPPDNTLFLLVAENESMILPTILSRCQLVKVPALTNADIQQQLVQKEGLSVDQAGQLAAISDGNYHEALQQLTHAGEDWQFLLREWLNAILKNGPASLVKWIDEVSKLGREKQKQFLRYFNHLLEQSIRLQVLGVDSEWASSLPVTEKDFMLRIHKMSTIAQQEAIVEEIDKAAYYIERNAHAKLLFHALSIRIFHILATKSKISAW